jgi:hypothetical protein
MGKYNQANTIKVGQLWSFDLSIQHNQLLAKQCIFYNQISMAACQI